MATNDDATPSRRGLLKIATLAAAAVPVGATAAGADRTVAASTDAELVALCAEWRRAMDHNMAVVDRLAPMLERDWSDEDRVLWDESQDAVSELEERIFGTKAMTMPGIKAKAGVLKYLDVGAGIPANPEQAASLVADVLALAGAA